MATKLNPATAKKVKALGINAKSEEDAREKLLEILKDNGIDGMEEEDTETLIDIAESFVEEGGETESEEQEAEELANEAEEEETEEDGKSDRERFEAYLDGLTVAQMKDYAKEGNLPAEEYDKLSSKKLMKAYLLKKYDETVEEED